MRKVDMCFIDCIDICKFMERKSFEKDVQKRLESDMLAYMFYICGKEINEKQINYIRTLLCLNLQKRDIPATVNQDILFEKMDAIHIFIMGDSCFAESDLKFKDKKTEKLIELFQAIGDDLASLAEKDKEELEGRINTYMQKMHALSLENATEVSCGTETGIADDGKTLEELVDEFNALTGLQSVKNEINGLINLVKISKMRKERGMKETSISKHMVFTGNPGTGKTTVARLLSNIYNKLGVLSKGQLIEVDRSGLVAGYTGQTAIKTDKVIQEAMGGILFIDEAYTLTEDKGEGDFGQEAVDTILKAMEDNRDDLVVIVAGYPDLMDGFLNSNPGLKSRFNKFIEFEDYSKEELLSIFSNMCKSMDYRLCEKEQDLLLEKIQAMLDSGNKSFANARTMRNLLEFAVMQQASRLILQENPSDEELQTIRFSDMEMYNLQ